MLIIRAKMSFLHLYSRVVCYILGSDFVRFISPCVQKWLLVFCRWNSYLFLFAHLHKYVLPWLRHSCRKKLYCNMNGNGINMDINGKQRAKSERARTTRSRGANQVLSCSLGLFHLRSKSHISQHHQSAGPNIFHEDKVVVMERGLQHPMWCNTNYKADVRSGVLLDIMCVYIDTLV